MTAAPELQEPIKIKAKRAIKAKPAKKKAKKTAVKKVASKRAKKITAKKAVKRITRNADLAKRQKAWLKRSVECKRCKIRVVDLKKHNLNNHR